MPKIVFFDIDNTLMDAFTYIPESTVRAVAQLRKNGHLAVLCSGRTRGFNRDPGLMAMDFDGIISGCGTQIEYRGEMVFQYLFEKDDALFAVETAKKYRFPIILEGPKHPYLDKEDFIGDHYVQRVEEAMGADLLDIRSHWGDWVMSKFSCAVNHETEEECLRIYAERYDFLRHNTEVIEIVPRGYDKCTGMAHLCAYLGIDRKDTYAVGDSANDIGMLQWAGTGIAMGSGQAAAKEAADYVTAGIRDDGVEKALQHFSLI